MQYRPVLQNLHALTDRPVLEQVKYRVQLQHRLTSLRTRLTDGRLTVETIPNPPIGVSPFRFRSPDEPAVIR